MAISVSASLACNFYRTKCFPLHPVDPRFSSRFSPVTLNLKLGGKPSTTRSLTEKNNDQIWEESDTFSKYSGYLFDPSLEFMDDYDPNKIAAMYRQRPFVFVRRLLQIGFTFGRWFGLRYLDRLRGRSDSMFKERAAEFRALLVQLGPAFVKIAQAVSSRPDVVPPEYLQELSLLQDRIAPFSTVTALEIIKDELGLPLETVFTEISIEPVAAASLGQVYQARLRPNGELVAVKVQRPGVRATISLDVLILRLLAGYIRKAGKFNSDLQAIVDEWASSLFREMDYEREAQNGMQFRKLYGSLPDVMVPKMYLDLSSKRVLVMEWIEGQKLSEVKDLHLVEVGVYCSLTQLLECGFYHADPHPGNLIRTFGGELAYIDFGMMGEFKQELRDGFIGACLHLVNRDFEALANDFITLGLLPSTSKMSDVSNALTGVFRDAVSKGVRNISFGDLSGNLGRTMYNYKFQIPSYFSLVIRSLAVLEGIALNNDPNYKVLGSSYPWIARKVLTDSSPQLRSALRSLLYEDGIFRVDRLESLIAESIRSPTDETLARKDKNANVGPKYTMKRILKFTLDEKGKFVREIFLDELVKGIDALNRVTFEKTAASIMSNFPAPSQLPIHVVEDEDLKSLDTMQQFITLLQELYEKENRDKLLKDHSNQITWNEALSILQQTQTMQNIMPVLSAILELPFSTQQEALNIPVWLAGRLISRVIARNIRKLI